VGEETRLVLSNSIQPLLGLGAFAAKSFELLHGPSQQMLIDVPCQGVKLGAVEGAVVADPASNHRVDLLGEAGQVRPAATVEVPVPNFLADCLPGVGADGR